MVLPIRASSDYDSCDAALSFGCVPPSGRSLIIKGAPDIHLKYPLIPAYPFFLSPGIGIPGFMWDDGAAAGFLFFLGFFASRLLFC